MKIVAISDLHGHFPKEIEPCDILCICGDITYMGTEKMPSIAEALLVQYFLPWLEKVPAKHIVYIAGNHDFLFQGYGPTYINDKFSCGGKARYIEDEMIEIDGITIYGTPWCPRLKNWAFYQPELQLRQKFSEIPDKIDILLTHTPPQYVNGVGEIRQRKENDFRPIIDAGCMELREAIINKDIGYVLSGHIHSGNHELTEWHDKKVANVSILDEDYCPTFKPLIFEI